MKKKSESASRAVGNADLEIPRMTRAEMRKGRTVGLDSDVARVFRDSESVNTVLRAIIQGLVAAKKRKKSA